MPKIERRRKFIKTLEAKSLGSRSFLSHLSDELTTFSGTPFFLVLNAILFVIWISINTGMVPGLPIFDPFPFGLLTMIVSLQAIILSIFVLISQNRSAYINTIRDEVHLQINLRNKEEITKILEILSDLRKKNGITKEDPELEAMLKGTDAGTIEHSIVAQLEKANKSLLNQLKDEFPDLLFETLKKPVEMIQNKQAESGKVVEVE